MTTSLQRFGGVRTLVAIGGGEVMLAAVEHARKIGLPVRAVLAARHAAEPLAGAPTAEQAYRDRGVDVLALRDMDAEPGWREGIDLSETVALCFGPAWVFSAEVRSAFGFGMYNVNRIPIPRYLGGAHFTWQIINDDRSAGCCLQAIEAEVDRGDVLRLELTELPASARLPEDYFRETGALAANFVARVLDDMLADAPFERRSFDEFRPRVEYYPRLMTSINGVIDWSWPVEAIERFCRGFDRPYPGAWTRWRGEQVRLRDVGIAWRDEGMHPFSAGLVLRQSAEEVVLGAVGGALRVGRLQHLGAETSPKLRLGDRLYSEPEDLRAALTNKPRFTAEGPAKT